MYRAMLANNLNVHYYTSLSTHEQATADDEASARAMTRSHRTRTGTALCDGAIRKCAAKRIGRVGG